MITQNRSFDEKKDDISPHSHNENKKITKKPIRGFAHVSSIQTKLGKKILRHMTVEFPERSITGILGPSGSGKTTFLNFISGNMPGDLTSIGEGEIRFHTEFVFLKSFTNQFKDSLWSMYISESFFIQ